jgi:uncharacterized protein DUF892
MEGLRERNTMLGLEAAQAEDLNCAIAVHVREAEGQVKRLERAFEIVGARPKGVECSKAVPRPTQQGHPVYTSPLTHCPPNPIKSPSLHLSHCVHWQPT